MERDFLDGAPVYRLAGTVPDDPEAEQVVLWVGVDDLLVHQLQVEGHIPASEVDERLVPPAVEDLFLEGLFRFSRFNEPVEIVAPLVAEVRHRPPALSQAVDPGELATVQTAIDSMMADKAVSSVTASTEATNSWSDHPTGTGTSPLHPLYLQTANTAYFYCWVSYGLITKQIDSPSPCEPPAPVPTAAEEEDIKAAIERLYELVSEERWSQVWESYTTTWRETCSFDGMVAYMEAQRDQGITRWDVSRFSNIYLLNGRASVSYTIVNYDSAGGQTGTYDYHVTLVREGNDWLWEESCFPPAAQPSAGWPDADAHRQRLWPYGTLQERRLPLFYPVPG